ncbi:MAG: glycosyltransferase [Candidatus Rokubacteria bacterium]|nr:glycosyltransferase [Candidatus Rokubacteria bacterium]
MTTETAPASIATPGERARAGARVRLLELVTTFAVGGTEGQVATLAEGLDHDRFELHLASLRGGGELRPRMERLAHGVVDYGIENLYGRRALAQRVRLARHLRRQRVDVVHSYNFYANVFAVPAARLAGAPVVIASIRDTGAYLTPLQRRVHREVCRLADGILVNADAIRRWLVAEGYDARKISVIANGVELGLHGRPVDRARLRRELGVPAGAPLVALVSRLSRVKGIEYFVEAAAALAPRHPDARFLIVGDEACADPGYADELKACTRRLGVADSVVFTGFRADVPDLLSEVAVSVLPSLTEGLSNTLLESMAAGLPVVATRVGGTPEAVEDGVTGLLVPPRDTAALARAISRTLHDGDLATRLGAAARQRATERFSVDAMIRATERLYVTMLATKRRNRE